MTDANNNAKRAAPDNEFRDDRPFSETIIQCLPGVFYAFNEGGEFVKWNRAAEVVTGLNSEEFGAARPTELIAEKDRDSVERAIAEVLERGRSSVDAHILSRDGKEVLHRLTGVRMDSGGTRYVVGMGVDLTERSEIERELRMARDVAEAANRAKSGFLATMNHELRTPLNAIIGFSQVLQDETFGPLNPKQAKYVDNVLSSGRALLALIDDILDLSAVDADPKALQKTAIQLGSFLENSLLLIREKAVKHGLSLDTDIPAEIGETVVEADKQKLRQVLHNLLTNAAKFSSDGGSIVLAARLQDTHVVVSVEDKGIGFKPEEADLLFEPFHQADSSAARRYEGTGLGLAICRKYIELHGGRIWADSSGEGKGSRFCFSIPCTSQRS